MLDSLRIIFLNPIAHIRRITFGFTSYNICPSSSVAVSRLQMWLQRLLDHGTYRAYVSSKNNLRVAAQVWDGGQGDPDSERDR